MTVRMRHAGLVVILGLWLGCVAPVLAEPSGEPTPEPALPKIKAGEIGIRCMVSTGEKHAGVLQRNMQPARDHFMIADDAGKPQRIFNNNLVYIEFHTAPPAEAATDEAADGSQYLDLARQMLKYKVEGLAIIVLQQLAGGNDADRIEFYGRQNGQPSLDEATRAKIETVYKESRLPLPVIFGGDSKRAAPEPEPRKYTCPTPQQIEANLAKAAEWATQAKPIAPETHLIETEHFLIYSAWPKSDDRALANIYSKLYKALCKQFDIPDEENIWAGKLPVYAFWEKRQYVMFATGTCGMEHETAQRSGGFAGRRGDFRYVVLGPVEVGSKRRSQRWFFELLTHESTHAFLGRFINDRHIISWVNEGIAETMAATLVPHCGAVRKMKNAHAELKRGNAGGLPDMLLAENIPLESFYYGCSQSLVRFLIKADRRKFIEFVELIKAGKTDEDALQATYGLSHQELLTAWARAVTR